MSGHFTQLGKNSIDVFVAIDESDNDWQVAACLNEIRGSHSAATMEASNGMERGSPRTLMVAS